MFSARCTTDVTGLGATDTYDVQYMCFCCSCCCCSAAGCMCGCVVGSREGKHIGLVMSHSGLESEANKKM